MFITLILIISLFIFLFCFYYFARDDFYFIRKGITLEAMFNVLFIGLFFSIIFSRIFYIILNFEPRFKNPLAIFLIPYFPGLSLAGGILGLYLVCFYVSKRRKITSGRFLDYISLALLSVLPILLFVIYSSVYYFIMYIVLFLFFILTLYQKYSKGLIKEGIISLLFLIMFALVSLLQDLFLLYQNNILLKKEDFIYIALFFAASFLLVRLEMKRPAKTS